MSDDGRLDRANEALAQPCPQISPEERLEQMEITLNEVAERQRAESPPSVDAYEPAQAPVAKGAGVLLILGACWMYLLGFVALGGISGPDIALQAGFTVILPYFVGGTIVAAIGHWLRTQHQR